METKGRRRTSIDLPTTISQPQPCNFEGYDAISHMTETAKLRKLITKRGTLEILIPLCCTTNPVRYLKFRQTLKGFSSKLPRNNHGISGWHVLLKDLSDWADCVNK